MKYLLLVADLHLSSAEPFGKKRWEYKFNILLHLAKNIVSDNDCIGLAILGDLFNAPNPGEYLRDQFYSCIETIINNRKFVIFVDGNHESSATCSCLSGESRIQNEYFKIFTGTTIQYLELPDFPKLLIVPWYASLTPYWWLQYKDITVLSHCSIHGSKMNENIECPYGIPVQDLKDRNIKILAGHFHIPQGTQNYVYIGSLFKHNFGDSYIPSYTKLYSSLNYKRIDFQDWNLISIEYKDLRKLQECQDKEAPTVIKIIFDRMNKKEFDIDSIKGELKELGFTNILHIKKAFIQNKIMKKNNENIDLNQSVVENILSYLRKANLPDHAKLLNKWHSDQQLNSM